MKWFWKLIKGLEAQSAMVDVFLAAMAGVTAADHERISKLRKSVWIIYASGCDEHVPAIGTV